MAQLFVNIPNIFLYWDIISTATNVESDKVWLTDYNRRITLAIQLQVTTSLHNIQTTNLKRNSSHNIASADMVLLSKLCLQTYINYNIIWVPSSEWNFYPMKDQKQTCRAFLNGWLQGTCMLVRIFQAHKAVPSAQKEYWEEIPEVVIHERNGPKSNSAWIYAGKTLFSKICCFPWKKNPCNASNGQCSCVMIVDIFHHIIGSITTFLKNWITSSVNIKKTLAPNNMSLSINNPVINSTNPLGFKSLKQRRKPTDCHSYRVLQHRQFTAGHTNFGEETMDIS